MHGDGDVDSKTTGFQHCSTKVKHLIHGGYVLRPPLLQLGFRRPRKAMSTKVIPDLSAALTLAAWHRHSFGRIFQHVLGARKKHLHVFC